MVETVLDTQFLFDPILGGDYLNRIASLLGFIELVIVSKKLCLIRVSSTWSDGYLVEGGLLRNPAVSKDITELILRLLGRATSYEGPLDEGICLTRSINPRFCPVFSLADLPTPVTCENVEVAVIVVTDSRSYQAFWRHVIRSTNLNSIEFDSLVEQAFWNLVVFPDARDRWDKMGHALGSIREKLVTHLEYLSDNAAIDRRASNGDNSIRQRLASARGVDMSPEGSLSRKARSDREKKLDGETHYCDWHTKIGPTEGRIYFTTLPNDAVFIGEVTTHLSNA